MTRLKYKLGDYWAGLVMDGFYGHDSPEIRALLEEHRIKVVWLLPHSSHLTQPLDLVTFSAFKRSRNSSNLSSEEEKETELGKRILANLEGIEKAAHTRSNINAWARAGFKTDWNAEPASIRFSVTPILEAPRAPENELKRAAAARRESTPKRVKVGHHPSAEEIRRAI